MQAVRQELDRLGRGIARRVGTRRGVWLHLVLLVLACLLAFVDRAVIQLPGLAWLEGKVVPTLVAGVLLLALGPFVRALAVRTATPDPRRLARDLDDEHGWHDETSTALTVPASATIVARLLAAQTTGRLESLASDVARRPGRANRILRYALAFLFVFLLLAPGVKPLWEGPGPGGDEPSWMGPTDGAVSTRPLESDWFFATFVEDPLPVEALPKTDDESKDTPDGGGK